MSAYDALIIVARIAWMIRPAYIRALPLGLQRQWLQTMLVAVIRTGVFDELYLS